jgi:hypothetical protein
MIILLSLSKSSKWSLPLSYQQQTTPMGFSALYHVTLRLEYLGSYVDLINAELKPIYHLLALLEAHHIFYVSGLRVKAGGVVWYCEYRPDRFCVPPNLMYSPYRRLFPRVWGGGREGQSNESTGW